MADIPLAVTSTPPLLFDQRLDLLDVTDLVCTGLRLGYSDARFFYPLMASCKS